MGEGKASREALAFRRNSAIHDQLLPPTHHSSTNAASPPLQSGPKIAQRSAWGFAKGKTDVRYTTSIHVSAADCID
jgi:hypothetical protein